MLARQGRLLVTNIGRLLTMVPRPGDLLGAIEGAAVLVENGAIARVGPRDSFDLDSIGEIEIIDAGGRLVTPPAGI